MLLSDIARGKDNNFNLIRISAAMAVLITHSFAIVSGSGNHEPFRSSLGMTIGDIAVDIFFIASGFLVSASLIKRGNIVEFFVSRILRIFPALWVMLILTIFIVGPCFTNFSFKDYFSSPDTWSYLIKCGTLVSGVQFNLPGVFEGNAYPTAVNGSLWSMPFEIRMYLGLVTLWWIVMAITRRLGFTRDNQELAFKATIISVFICAALLLIYKHHHGSTGKLAKLLFMFSCGSVFFVLRNRINLNHWLLTISLVALFAALLNQSSFFYVYCSVVAYILFFIAYIPSGTIRNYNLLGDYSYGLYIYAFPVQQSISALFPGISVINMTLASGGATLILATASWHYLEERALGWRHAVTRHLQNH